MPVRFRLTSKPGFSPEKVEVIGAPLEGEENPRGTRTSLCAGRTATSTHCLLWSSRQRLQSEPKLHFLRHSSPTLRASLRTAWHTLLCCSSPPFQRVGAHRSVQVQNKQQFSRAPLSSLLTSSPPVPKDFTHSFSTCLRSQPAQPGPDYGGGAGEKQVPGAAMAAQAGQMRGCGPEGHGQELDFEV